MQLNKKAAWTRRLLAAAHSLLMRELLDLPQDFVRISM